MKKILLPIILITALALAAAAQAAPLSQEAIVNGISSRYQGINSISASYSRVASTPKTDKIFQNSSSQMATGLLSWSRPAKLLLDQKSPQPETMVTDGSTVWWYIPSESLAYRYRNMDVAGQLRPLLNFLSGLDSLRANFEISLAKADPGRMGQHGLALKPKVRDGNVNGITVWCDDGFNLTGFRLNAATGETTDFYLTGFMENPKLNDSIFKFKPPKGVDLIDED
ncbi:hypothetical protein C4J81_07630 [Deltaproteobacteria bacterium Smac51]|nr:hypothetical protein C4J81_07630 [Deltaproteobacteria bacterium Smac51]